jgi:hypothetical protein
MFKDKNKSILLSTLKSHLCTILMQQMVYGTDFCLTVPLFSSTLLSRLLLSSLLALIILNLPADDVPSSLPWILCHHLCHHPSAHTISHPFFILQHNNHVNLSFHCAIILVMPKIPLIALSLLHILIKGITPTWYTCKLFKVLPSLIAHCCRDTKPQINPPPNCRKDRAFK